MKVTRRTVSLGGLGLLAASSLTPAYAVDDPLLDPFEGRSDF